MEQKERTFKLKMVNSGKYREVDARPEISVSVLARNEYHAIRKAEYQHPCFKVAT